MRKMSIDWNSNKLRLTIIKQVKQQIPTKIFITVQIRALSVETLKQRIQSLSLFENDQIL
jgi:hypothetical protein